MALAVTRRLDTIPVSLRIAMKKLFLWVVDANSCAAKLFDNASFDLPVNVRSTLSYILIVHPVAAFFTLIMLVLAGSAHTHKASHSPRFLLGIFILSILTLILALLAFLIDVLLFVPHMAWGSYMVLAATVLIAASGIVSCAMRRTLVSRKARKRRIAENAEMNGENYYARQGGDATTPAVSNTMTGSLPVSDNKTVGFATFDLANKEEGRTSDERIPLTTKTPTENSPSNVPGSMAGGLNDRYRGPSPPRDQYGNPMPGPPSSSGYGNRSRDPSVDPSLNRQYSDNSMGSRGGRGGMPYRGRGPYGPPPNGRGGYGPPPGGRGGYRGGYGGQPRGGGYGPPGRGPSNEGMMSGAAAGMAAGGMMRGGRGGGPGRGGFDNRGMSPYGRRSQDGQDMYNRNMSPRPPPQGQYAAYPGSEARSSLPRAESPPPLPGLDTQGPVGQAIEMDATTGSPSNAPKGFGNQYGPLRDSDGDVAGMVGLQQQRQNLSGRDTMVSDGSRYSTEDAYVPPRQAWGDEHRTPSPLNPAAHGTQPVELPTGHQSARKRTVSGDNYYEDVAPQFAEQPSAHPSMMPAALAPGNYGNGGSSGGSSGNLRIHPGGLDGNNSYEDLQSGSRSPAESDRSNFTSVSQRGINPRWNGNGGQQNYAPMPNRRPVGPPQPRREDLLLNSNPDFQLPGGRGGRGAASAGGGAYPTGAL